MLIGYARVSTQDQNLDLQTEALTKAGCKRIFNDKISGSRAERPGLTKALEMLREGDTLHLEHCRHAFECESTVDSGNATWQPW